MPRAKGGSIPSPQVMVEQGHGGTVTELNEHDVLCGRGGKINNHPGNVTFRTIVEEYKHEYLDPRTRKLEKAHVAARLVAQIRNTNPPGRFLKPDDPVNPTGYVEIGDLKAWKKAGQALREDAPDVRKEIIEEVLITEGVDLAKLDHHQQQQLHQQQSSPENIHRQTCGIPPTVSYLPLAAMSGGGGGPRPDPPEAPGVTGYRQPPLRYGESVPGGVGRGGVQGGGRGGGGGGGQGIVSGRGRGAPPPQGYPVQVYPGPPPPSYFRASPPVWNVGGGPPPHHQRQNYPPSPHFQQQPYHPAHHHGLQFHPWWNGGQAWTPSPQFATPQHLHRKTSSKLDQSKGTVQSSVAKHFPHTTSIGTEFTMSDVTNLDDVDQIQRLDSDLSFGDTTTVRRGSSNNSGNTGGNYPQIIHQGAKRQDSGSGSESMELLLGSNLSLLLGGSSIARTRSFPDLLLSTGDSIVVDDLGETIDLNNKHKTTVKAGNGGRMERPYHRKSLSLLSTSSSISMASSRGFGMSEVYDTLSIMSVTSRKGDGTDKSETLSWTDAFNSMQSIHSSDMIPKLNKGEDGSVGSFLSDVSGDLNALDLDMMTDSLLPPLARNDSFNMGKVKHEHNMNRPDP